MSNRLLGLSVAVCCFGIPTARHDLWLLLQLGSPFYLWCPPAGSGVTAKTSTSNLASTTSSLDNMAYSDSMLSTTSGMWLKLCRRWEVKTIFAGSSARRSQQTLVIYLGLPGLSNFLSR